MPEPLLSRLIAELRKHVLVDEKLIRRIYYALLNGNVILAGPPGTGKTELAKLLPEILWQSEDLSGLNGQFSKKTAYATTLVTATSEWTTRTLISSIIPKINQDKITYQTQRGHLTEAILRNWAVTRYQGTQWGFHGRTYWSANSVIEEQSTHTYRGHWLIIDEFNRAPIDAALGEALTALGNGESLLATIDGSHVRIPLPKDFRIIGTLNNFDRNYLNQISEALKRRFAFIEITPPSRAQRNEEQGIVLYKVLNQLAHLSNTIAITATSAEWANVVMVEVQKDGTYHAAWEEAHPLYKVIQQGTWPLLEVLRIYRQLGTAQVITLLKQMLTPGILEEYTEETQWAEALDIALCDTIADQLQVLMPDELDVLISYLKLSGTAFAAKYRQFLSELQLKKRRLTAHLEALSKVVNEQGKQIIDDATIEDMLEQEQPFIEPDVLEEIFHLDRTAYSLPYFTRRLRTYKTEHGL